MEDLKKSLLEETSFIEQLPKPMGIGKIGSPECVFVRKFRWEFEGINLSSHFMKSVNFNFKCQTINLEIYEVAVGKEDINVQSWLETDLSKEKLLFTTYDGCGASLYSYEFTGIVLTNDHSNFDYSSSEASTRHVSLSYKNCVRTFHQEQKNKTSKYKKGFDWKVKIVGSDRDPVLVEIANRPTLHVEEEAISHLNATTWIPSKATWQKLNMKLDANSRFILTDLIGKFPDIELSVYTKDSCKLLETWTLKKTNVCAMSFDEEENPSINLSFGEVLYNNLSEEINPCCKSDNCCI